MQPQQVLGSAMQLQAAGYEVHLEDEGKQIGIGWVCVDYRWRWTQSKAFGCLFLAELYIIDNESVLCYVVLYQCGLFAPIRENLEQSIDFSLAVSQQGYVVATYLLRF
jgi:hypothetical protein